MDIRKAKLTDAAQLVACIDAAYAKYALRISDLPQVSSGVDGDIVTNQVWVGVQDCEIVAGLFLVPGEGYLKLANLVVHPKHSGKGIGRILMEHLEHQARLQRLTELRLNTHVDMAENISLYQHLGWEKVSTTGNVVSMRKLL